MRRYRYSSGRVMFLMNSARRKRSADQSSSIATMRTGSKPASPWTATAVAIELTGVVLRALLRVGKPDDRISRRLAGDRLRQRVDLFLRGDEAQREVDLLRIRHRAAHGDAFERRDLWLEARRRIHDHDVGLVFQIEFRERVHDDSPTRHYRPLSRAGDPRRPTSPPLHRWTEETRAASHPATPPAPRDRTAG